MINNIRPAIVSLLFFTILFGAVYPAVTTLVTQVLFPSQTAGSFIKGKNGEILGSALIGQNFTENKYFWGRLSATGPTPYNAAASSGANLGVNNSALHDMVAARVNALKQADPQNKQPIPVDLATASSSGLDPEISIAAAEYQISRVAQARQISQQQVQQLINRYTEKRQLGFMGEPRVNVLKLNLALDGKI